jgi:hypothetical protein
MLNATRLESPAEQKRPGMNTNVLGMLWFTMVGKSDQEIGSFAGSESLGHR